MSVERTAQAASTKPGSRVPLSRSRQGISPLIATVLLLAFAVAIGTMIVSYLIDASNADSCRNVQIALESSAHACYSGGHVSFIIANQGDKAITGVVVRLIGTGQDVTEHDVPLSLASASATKIDVAYQVVDPQGVSVTVIPKILSGGNEKACTSNALQMTLGTC